MIYPTLPTAILTILLLPTLLSASPLHKRDTAEQYKFANCINNVTLAAYSAIFYYYPDFLPDFPSPQATASVNALSASPFYGQTTTVSTPFTLKATIPANASTAAVGTLVSTDASASSYAGPMAVIKGSGLVFYSPEDNVNCYEEYWQRDNESVDN
ncbi:hypothetical protein LHYA1_G007602 [Lachnellula hyalina]|uniref:Uncharacterized protein n=1 Tax=Lachnellula hyalina TaxID=1316788 RepID=A0A8H8QZV3_9HELO|nr:uncharacterized protein LHYA1_G007602 [Lachnellula hyalina]TVY24334.1 hypothetical protein LHYA1_G007602 [Lachnellula hyalina]